MKFCKKPLIIEAVEFTGLKANYAEIVKFCPGIGILPGDKLLIKTLEGYHIANLGDWIIRGIANEFYPCKDLIFRGTYEPVDTEAKLALER